MERYSLAQSEQSIAGFDESNGGLVALYKAFSEARKLRDLSNIYTLMDRDNTYYVGSKSGLITAYGDQDPQDSHSPIVELSHFRLPAQVVTGPIMGLNMSYDGWLVAATEHGYLVAIRRDFSDYRFDPHEIGSVPGFHYSPR